MNDDVSRILGGGGRWSIMNDDVSRILGGGGR